MHGSSTRFEAGRAAAAGRSQGIQDAIVTCCRILHLGFMPIDEITASTSKTVPRGHPSERWLPGRQRHEQKLAQVGVLVG